MADPTKERENLLDAFASAPERPAGNLPAPISRGAAVVTPIGAQAVAVRRDEASILSKLKAIAAAAGDDFYYRFPVKNRKENRTDYIEGPSIKCANEVARLYGNCAIDTIVDDLGDAWMIYARFTDFETGFTMTRPFQQRKNAGRLGGGDDARNLDIALAIGASKAIRNVVTNALGLFTNYAFEEAKNSIVEKIGKNLAAWRERMPARLAENGIEPRRAEVVLGKPISEWTAPDMARVVAMVKTIVDGMATLDETFPPVGTVETKAETERLDQFAEGDGKATETKPAATSGAKAKTSAKPAPAEAKAPAKTEPEADRAAAATAAGASPETGEFPDDEGDPAREETPADVAYNRGFEHRRKGGSRKAIPGEYQAEDRKVEAEAWSAGFDEADRMAKEGEAK